MECNHARELLSGYLDGELRLDIADQVQQHLQRCAKCSHELKYFQQMGSLVVSVKTPSPAPETWDRIASKLDAAPTIRRPDVLWSKRSQLLMGIVAAVAASILLIVGLRMPVGSHSNHGHSSPGIAVDYQDILHAFARKPSAAIDAISQRFEGQEASADEAQTLLGYRPSVSNALPEGIQLVSTTVLKMPPCNCSEKSCTCGPTGCNCAASVCQRSDGSEFLVVEHCESQNVSFGHDAATTATFGNQTIQFLESADGLAVSWIADKRRLTAIGVRDSEEAKTLVATIGKFRSSH